MEKSVVFCLVFFSSICLLNASCSLGVYESGVSEADQNKIRDKHNALRLQLAQGLVVGQPRAINMLRMSYDIKLGQAAQNIANTCDFQHVPVSDSRWTWVGQNLYLTMSTSCIKGPEWDKVIQGWFDENKNYRYPSNPATNTGHYTQIAWATSNYVGCGYTFFKASGTFKCQKLYVCNYGPGGNILGQAPYKTGSSGCNNLC